MQYIKKSVVIEAIEWTGKNHREMFNFLFDGEAPNDQVMRTEGKNFYISHGKCTGGLVIKTLEGEQIAQIGDFIIKGVEGEFYPCKPGKFNKTHTANDFKSRLKQECADLREKTDKLGQFLVHKNFNDLPREAQEQLLAQYKAMNPYLFILEERLETLGVG